MAKVIVTGSSRGIGYELVKLLEEEGHEILALSRNPGPVSRLRSGRISGFPFDLTKATDIIRLKEFIEKEWKGVDVLINNAGMLVNKPFLETSPEEFKKVYDVNLFGLVEITRTVLPWMPEDGHVVNISSMGGIQGSIKFPGLSAYSSSKAAVIALTELLAEEFKESGPSFNALALGAVQTEMLEEAFPGYRAPVTAAEMAAYIKDFCLTGHRFCNGKVLQLSSSTP
jgi:NAD(P)-dependent dehydrogenase (short-subunit alcohol dehydrogenase family)